AVMAGNIAAGLGQLESLYQAGADPVTLIADLADLTHLVTRLKIVPSAADDVSLTPDERTRGAQLAQKLGMRALSRAWQILFKGHEEVTAAGNALQAAEMVLVRLAYAADLPTPDELIERLRDQPAAPIGGPMPQAPRNGGGATALRQPSAVSTAAPAPTIATAAPAPARAEALPAGAAPQAGTIPRSYAELVALAREQRDLLLKHALEGQLRPVSFAEGRIEVALAPGADPGLIQMLSARLKQWTGRNWMISVANNAPAGPTLREIRQQRETEAQGEATGDPLVSAILEMFPGATVKVRLREEEPPPPPPLSDAELEAQFDAQYAEEVAPDADLLPDETDDTEEDD
ncbi:MAG TPA: DNA polymerase III subunit gamma/tau, partial [Devosiaceae bacterium]|nr:DNA polymerase III subunit gamma/tau [Devosiaceae bacterium]